MTNILITGALGQLGYELTQELRKKYGNEQIVASDIQKAPAEIRDQGPYVYLDVLDQGAIEEIVVDYNIDWLVHYASILSATGEKNPHLALDVNARGFENAMEVARKHNLRILAPSSIAAFGKSTPSDNTPDETIMRPNTMYGITKVWLELLGDYYHQKWGVDFRSLRYPGVISWKEMPGGGTTDYAVEVFYEALREQSYECFLEKDAALPMMYVDDTIRGTIELLETNEDNLEQRVFNMAAISFTPKDIATEISKHIPEFEMTYDPDYRQLIAESWPNSLDDTAAREQWDWQHEFDLGKMTKEMLENLANKLDIQYQSKIKQQNV